MYAGVYTFEAHVGALREAIHKQLGWLYQGPSSPPPVMLPMNGFGMIVTRGNGFAYRGSIQGQAYGAQQFSLYDVTARRLAPRNEFEEPRRAGFEGVIVSLRHPDAFVGRTIVRRDMGTLNPSLVDGMERVGMADSNFERLFEVYSDDQVEARTLLTPDFIERVALFSDDFLGRGVQLAFLGGQVHVSLEIDDRFDFNRPIKAFDFKEASGSILNEIGGVFTVLEAVQALQSRIGREGHLGADRRRHKFYFDLMQALRKEVAEMETDWKSPQQLPEFMRDTHYLICDSFKHLMFPRF